MEKLTIKHLAPYLPYDLKVSYQQLNLKKPSIEIIIGIADNYVFFEESETCVQGTNFSYIKPILRPLSDYADINSKSMNELNCDLLDQIQISDLAKKSYHFQSANYNVALLCFEYHIDVFGLINKGLAIDINTL